MKTNLFPVCLLINKVFINAAKLEKCADYGTFSLRERENEQKCEKFTKGQLSN